MSPLILTTTEGAGTAPAPDASQPHVPLAGSELESLQHDASDEEAATKIGRSGATGGKAVIFLNHARKIVAAHPSCNALFGWEPEELVGRDFKVLLEAGWHDEIAGILTQEEGTPQGESGTLLEVTALRKEGTEFSTQLSVKWLPENRWFCWTAAFGDQACTPEATEPETLDQEAQPKPGPSWQNSRLRSKSEGQVQDERIGEMQSNLETVLAANADLEKRLAEEAQSKERSLKLSAELEDQLTSTRTALENAERSRAEKEAQYCQLEEELSSLRQLRDELRGQLTTEQQTAAEARQQANDSKEQLQAELTELRQVCDELQSKLAEQQAGSEAQHRAEKENERLQAELSDLRRTRDELQAKLESEQRAAAEARGQMKTSNDQVQAELAELRQVRDGLQARLSTEQQAAAEVQQQADELKEQLRQSAASLERVTMELQQQSPERERLKSQCRTLTEANEALSAELNRLRESEAARQEELIEVERRGCESADAVAHITAQLEKQREERHQIERQAACLSAQLEDAGRELNARRDADALTEQRIAELEQRLKEQDTIVTRLTADLQNETAVRQMTEEQLRSVVAVSAQLRKDRACLEDAKTAFQRTLQDFEAQIHAGLNVLAETPSPSQPDPVECPSAVAPAKEPKPIALLQ